MKKPDLLTAICEAFKAGFICDFLLHLNGSLYQYGKPNKWYSETDFLIKKPIDCPESRATLYLLMSTDGIRGTWVHHWEHQDS